MPQPLVRPFLSMVKPSYRTRFESWWVRNLDEVRASLNPDRPLVFVANHTSWWDGFFIRQLQEELKPRSDFHFMMLERELDRNPWFKWMGATPIQPGSVSSVRAAFKMIEKARWEQEGRFCGMFFPQGRIWPSTKRPLAFRPGVCALVSKLGPVDIIPVGIHIEPMQTRSPHAFLSLGLPIQPEECESAVERELDRILEVVNRFGEDWLREGREQHGWKSL